MTLRCFLVVCLLGGCASPTVVPPPQDLRASMQHVELRVTAPQQYVSRPDEIPVGGTGEGAAYGAEAGAVGAFGTSLYVGGLAGCDRNWKAFVIFTCPLGIVAGAAAGVVTAVPAAAVGAAIGSGKAESKEKVEAAVATFEAVVTHTSPSELLREKLAASIRNRAGAEVVMEPTADPPLDIMKDHLAPIIIDVALTEASLSMVGRLDPELTYETKARAGLRTRSGSGWLYERTWGYYAEIGEYFPLLEDDGAGLRGEVEAVYAKLADAIVEDLFLSNVPKSIIDEPRSAEGEVVTISAHIATTPFQQLPSLPPSAKGQVLPADDTSVVRDATVPEGPGVMGIKTARVSSNGEWFDQDGAWSLYLKAENGKLTGQLLHMEGDHFSIFGTISGEGIVMARVVNAEGAPLGSVRGRFPTITLEQSEQVKASFDLAE